MKAITTYKTNKNDRGFTLIELVVYIAIFGIAMIMISSLTSLIQTGRARNLAINTVELEGSQAMSQITQLARNATAITVPVLGGSGASLSMTVYGGTSGAEQITLSSGVLMLTLSPASPVALTSTRVVVSGLSIKNNGKTGTNGSVQISFTLSSVISPSIGSYTKTFTNTASIRRK